jgi:penicillin-binding protein 1A
MGLRVRTPLDPVLQRAGERELTRQIHAAETGKLGKLSIQRCGADHDQCLEGMFVALDAHTGDVIALVGGRDYQQSQFDRATQARRQPGSAFKPFVWAAALENGIAASTLLDTTVPPGDYVPADGQAATDHPLNLREALRISSNRAAVALGQKVGLQPVADVARACGIEDPIPPWPSTFLGAAEVTPLALVAAFAPFANGGERIQPRFLDEVKSATGELLFTETVEAWQALPPQVSFIMSSLLSDVVARGTGMAARVPLPPDLPVLGKTGTTNGAQDVWFVGATPEIVAGVWMGFDRPRPLGPSATGGRLAAPVWGRVIAAWQKGREVPPPWQPPEGVEQHDVDLRTAGLANGGCPREQVGREWFAQGTIPPECPEHKGGLSGFLERTFGRIFR